MVSTVYFYQEANNLYPVPSEAIADACKHALRDYPQESCGVVKDGVYVAMENVHETPLTDYRINPAHLHALGKIDAVLHSHPQGQEGASLNDMQSQLSMGVPYGIVVMLNNNVRDVIFFGDQVPVAPLIGRPFKAGIYDCYAALRDKYRTTYGITLKDYPRDADWWLDPEGFNYLEDLFEDAGFTRIDMNDLRPGDVVLGRPFRATRINHCAVYIGNGLVYHHFGSANSQRVSNEESFYNLQKAVTHCLRHSDLHTSAS